MQLVFVGHKTGLHPSNIVVRKFATHISNGNIKETRIFGLCQAFCVEEMGQCLLLINLCCPCYAFAANVSMTFKFAGMELSRSQC